MRPIWNEENELSDTGIKLSFEASKKPKNYNKVNLSSFEYSPILKRRIEEVEKNNEIQFIQPKNPNNYYQNKIRPIWAEKSKLASPETVLFVKNLKKQKILNVNKLKGFEYNILFACKSINLEPLVVIKYFIFLLINFAL